MIILINVKYLLKFWFIHTFLVPLCIKSNNNINFKIMKEKIEKSLSIFDGLLFTIWFENSVDCGIITIHRSSISSAILQELSNVVELVAISCNEPNCYNITFMAK